METCSQATAAVPFAVGRVTPCAPILFIPCGVQRTARPTISIGRIHSAAKRWLQRLPNTPKKSARELSRGRCRFLAGTTFPLGFCRCGSGRFLVLNYSGWLAQHDFAHEHPVTNCRVVDCCRHIWPNGRPSYSATFRIYNGRVSRVVITHRRRTRRCSEHKVIRIRSVCHDCTGTAGCCLLSCRRARYRVGCGRSRGLLRQRNPQGCRASQSSRQYFH